MPWIPNTQISRALPGDTQVPVYYVTNYGTLTFGFTGGGGNAAIIQAALDAAKNHSLDPGNNRYGAIVQLPAGPIPIQTGLTVSGSVWFRGAGPGLTELYWTKASAGGETMVLVDSTNSQAKVSDMQIVDGTGNATIGLHLQNGVPIDSQYGGIFTEVERVFIAAGGNGGSYDEINCVGLKNQGFENRFLDVYVAHTNGAAFYDSGTDNFYSNCTADTPVGDGFLLATSNTKMVNCKAFGGSSGHNAPAFNISGTRNMLSNCEAQDYFGPGFLDNGGDNMFTSCIADTCGQGLSGTNSYGFLLSGGSTAAGCIAMNRSGTPQQYGYRGGITNSVYPVFTGCTSRLPGIAHVDPAIVGAVDVNNLRGVQSVAYAASITPDPFLGGTVIVGTLTNTLTVNAVASAGLFTGMRVGFQLTQDGSGHAVTFNGQYKTTSAISTTASAVTRIQFEFDGTNFRETGRAVT